MKQYCPYCLKDLKLTTKIIEQKRYTSKYGCWVCSAAFWNKSELLTKEEAMSEVKAMISELKKLKKKLINDTISKS